MAISTDPLTKRSKDIASMVPYWDKVDAILDGLEGMRRGKTTYLPQFSEETDKDYAVRLATTKFTNVFRDVTESLAAKPFEEEVTLIGEDVPPEITEFADNVDGSGNNLTVFAAKTFFNSINYAIDWIFVDYPTVDRSVVRTKADEKAAGLKPYWNHVLAQNVLEVRTKIIGSQEVISYIRILEPSMNDGKDKVRVFERSDASVVTWELFERSDKPVANQTSEFRSIATGTLSIGVIPLVPFATGRRNGKTFKFLPPMQDVADLQVTLYQNESALEFITTIACYPMLAGNGISPELDESRKPKKLAISPTQVLYAPIDGSGNHGEWKYIEPSATSMEFTHKKIMETKRDLRELGRQPLTVQSQQLTTITTAVAAGKAGSAARAWALLLKDALENALVITQMWMGITYDIKVNVFTEFDSMLDNADDLDQLGSARDRGDISRETLWSEMKRRKVLSVEFDPVEEEKRLLNEIPSEGFDNPNADDPPSSSAV